MFVSNLDRELDEDDLANILTQLEFDSKVSNTEMNYDKEGTFRGTAVITFKSGFIARKFVKDCDGTDVDGRDMGLKLIGGSIEEKTVQAPRRQDPPRSGGGADDRRGARRDSDRERRPARRQSDGRGRGDRGSRDSRGQRQQQQQQGGRGGRGSGGRPARREDRLKTNEDLDKDLDSYKKRKNRTQQKQQREKRKEMTGDDLDKEMDEYRQKKKKKTEASADVAGADSGAAGAADND